MRKINPARRIYILGADQVGWSIDQDRAHTIDYLKQLPSVAIVSSIWRANFIYAVWYDVLLPPRLNYLLRFLKIIKGIKIAAVVTNNIANTPEKITRLKAVVDTWIAPSCRTYQYLQKQGLTVIQLPFLVSPTTFKPLKLKPRDVAQKLGLDYRQLQGRKIIGSFQRDTEGSDLRTPKWQKNPGALIKILNPLPRDQFLLLLAGPRRHYLIRQCRRHQIPYLFLGDESYIDQGRDDIIANNLSLTQINLLYNLIDFYLVTSRSEGGPKAVLEAALTQKLIFSPRVGLAPDILNSACLYRLDRLAHLRQKIERAFQNPVSFQPAIDYNFKKAQSALDNGRILKTLAQVIAS